MKEQSTITESIPPIFADIDHENVDLWKKTAETLLKQRAGIDPKTARQDLENFVRALQGNATEDELGGFNTAIGRAFRESVDRIAIAISQLEDKHARAAIAYRIKEAIAPPPDGYQGNREAANREIEQDSQRGFNLQSLKLLFMPEFEQIKSQKAHKLSAVQRQGDSATLDKGFDEAIRNFVLYPKADFSDEEMPALRSFMSRQLSAEMRKSYAIKRGGQAECLDATTHQGNSFVETIAAPDTDNHPEIVEQLQILQKKYAELNPDRAAVIAELVINGGSATIEEMANNIIKHDGMPMHEAAVRRHIKAIREDLGRMMHIEVTKPVPKDPVSKPKDAVPQEDIEVVCQALPSTCEIRADKPENIYKPLYADRAAGRAAIADRAKDRSAVWER